MCPNWIVTYTSYCAVAFFTRERTCAQSPPRTKETVVAPLWPLLAPKAGARSVERKPLPQPPPPVDWIAVVESPARKNAAGFGWGGGAARAREDKRREARRVEKGMVEGVACLSELSGEGRL